MPVCENVALFFIPPHDVHHDLLHLTPLLMALGSCLPSLASTGLLQWLSASPTFCALLSRGPQDTCLESPH